MSRQRVGEFTTSALKRLDLRSFLPGARLAIRVSGLVCAFIVPGCLVPQDIEPIVIEPHASPVFEVDSFQPYLTVPTLQLYRGGAADAAHTPLPCHCQLQIPPLPVFDADPTVDLQTRWFIDYDASLPNTTGVRSTSTIKGTFNDSTATTRVFPGFVFDPDARQITTSGSHVLDVVVGEPDGFDPNEQAAQPGRTMLPNFKSAVYRFFIDVQVEQDPARPTCSNTLPSVRVCPP